tara:strand:+ start:84 stop:401 length:318 start_codon:yes stop_codon:yes gene_type:complete
LSFSSVLTQFKRHLHGNNPKWSAAPTQSSEVADLWNVYEMSAPGNNPKSLGLNDDFSSALLNLGVIRLNSPDLLQLQDNIQAWFQQQAPDISVAMRYCSPISARC